MCRCVHACFNVCLFVCHTLLGMPNANCRCPSLYLCAVVGENGLGKFRNWGKRRLQRKNTRHNLQKKSSECFFHVSAICHFLATPKFAQFHSVIDDDDDDELVRTIFLITLLLLLLLLRYYINRCQKQNNKERKNK